MKWSIFQALQHSPPIFYGFTAVWCGYLESGPVIKYSFAPVLFCESVNDMVSPDAELMEASLIAGAEAGVELRFALFDKFFTAWSERRADFLNLDAASRRMTDETLEMMMGLAKDEEHWVWPLVAELAFTHRSYGQLPWVEYESWVALTIETVAEAAGSNWNSETEAAWVRQGERLKAFITKARNEWDEVMPGHFAGSLSPH